MVARISSGRSIRGILVYNEQKVEKGEAKVMLASGFATDIDRLSFHQRLFRFEQRTMLNARSKVNAMHISLNFHADDKLDLGKMQLIASEYMEKIGMGEQPFIAYQHFDSAHPHLHIATVLIDKQGHRLDTNNIGRERSEPARVLLEQKFGLVKAEGRRLSSEPYLRAAEYGALPTKKQLAGITKAVMSDYAYTSFAEYKAVLAQFNVHVDRGFEDSVMFQNKGLVYSIMDPSDNPVGVPFKASSFYRGATMKELEKRFEKNSEKRKSSKQNLQERVDSVMGRYSTVSIETLVRELASERVGLVLRRNEVGRIYGLTFIDHQHRTVFNGSDLGKGYAAMAVIAMFSEMDVPRQYLDKEISINFLDKGFGASGKQVRDEENLWDGLLKKADYDDPTVIGKKRRGRSGEERSQAIV